jgi:REP element-mobilizing transposase RayT
MANTYSCLHYHIVFSTKNRERWIKQSEEERLWAYLGGIAREHGFTPIRVGGVEDHVHLLLGIPPRVAVSHAVQQLKGVTSGWAKEHLTSCPEFSWQDGYGAFTVSKSLLTEAEDYIRNQREHHRVKTFKEEFIAILKRHEIQYDEKFLWG